jgi:integrase
LTDAAGSTCEAAGIGVDNGDVRKSGPVYRVQWRDEQGRQRSKTFTNKRDAESFEARVKLAKRQGELAALDAGRQTLKAFSEDWWELHAEPGLAPKTRELYRWLLDTHLLPRLGHVQLRALTAERIQRAAAEMLAGRVPAETTRKALTLLRGILERAAEWSRITHNPARYVRKPPRETRRLAQPLSPRQVERLRRRMREQGSIRNATLVSVLAYAGLRPGEALALRWGDIGQQTIQIDKALSLGDEKGTKNRRNRTVWLLGPLTTDLAEWRLASGRPEENQLIFPTRAGAPWAQHDYQNWRRRHFAPAARAVGLTTVPYNLRHSFASLLFAQQTNPAEIAGQLGHSLQMLFSTYAHVIDELRGRDRVSAEDEIRAARAAPAGADVAQRLPAVSTSEVEGVAREIE